MVVFSRLGGGALGGGARGSRSPPSQLTRTACMLCARDRRKGEEGSGE